MEKAIVTGANGFVGYWLIKELIDRGVKVTAVIKDRKENLSMFDGMDNITFVYCDLKDLGELPVVVGEKGFDAFYHLAWVSAGGAGRADYTVQLLNVKYVCDAVAAAHSLECAKILFAGTITEKIAENILNLEAKAQNNIYGVCKHAAHCLVDIECKKYGIEYIWMQFSNLYGPYSINGNIVGYTLKELLTGNDATFGPATQPYDLLYIEDLAYAAYLLGENRTPLNTYYIGTGDVRRLSDYLTSIGNAMGMVEKIKVGVRPDDGTRYKEEWFDITPLRTDVGFCPRFSLDQGIKKTAEWLTTTLTK